MSFFRRIFSSSPAAPRSATAVFPDPRDFDSLRDMGYYMNRRGWPDPLVRKKLVAAKPYFDAREARPDPEDAAERRRSRVRAQDEASAIATDHQLRHMGLPQDEDDYYAVDISPGPSRAETEADRLYTPSGQFRNPGTDARFGRLA